MAKKGHTEEQILRALRQTQGNLPEALKSYRDSLAIVDRLAKADPGNAGWQRDLAVSYEKVGDVLVAQGNLPDAFKSYRDSSRLLTGWPRLIRAIPGWQHDLAVSYGRVATVERRLNAREEAEIPPRARHN